MQQCNSLPVGEDGQLHRVTLRQQVGLVDLGPLHIHLDVQVGCQVSCALGFHHNGADVIDQNGGTRNLMPRF